MSNTRMIRALSAIRPSVVLLTLLLCWSAVVSAEELYFVHTDHLGTPRMITDANQQTVWEGKQLPFGETDISNSQIEYNLRFPGQYYDSESGLHYNYFRDYDPSLGRYVQSDPIGLAGGLNTYAYVENSPFILIDPEGLRLRAPVRRRAGSIGYSEPLSWWRPRDWHRYERQRNFERNRQKWQDWQRRSQWECPTEPEPFMPPNYWDSLATQRAPTWTTPYNTYNRYNGDGGLRQTTTYDQFGRRHRQYDVNDGRRSEHQHNFEYSSQYPQGTRTTDHRPISE